MQSRSSWPIAGVSLGGEFAVYAGRILQDWSVRDAWVLSGILDTAVEYGYHATNPARGAKFPQKGLKEKPTIIAGHSFARLLRQVGERHRTMVSLIAATGLRIGELLALRRHPIERFVEKVDLREAPARSETHDAAESARRGHAAGQAASGAAALAPSWPRASDRWSPPRAVPLGPQRLTAR